MQIKNGLVFGENGTFSKQDIACEERITQIGTLFGPADIDATGKYVIPGLIDIHSHGALGADASDGDINGLAAMSLYYASHGVTAWCPTTMSLPEADLTAAVCAIQNFTSRGARCVGIHLEGPFLGQKRRGAQRADYLRRPDLPMFLRLCDACGGLVRLITVAPEEDTDTCSFIREASRICTVSLGHSSADYTTACRAFQAGASHVTHMFNGMNGIHHREPGIIGAAYDCGASAELICDGFHIHPGAIRMAERLFRGRLALVSDSMRCAGLSDGTYELGGQIVTVQNGKTTLPEGNLAGSSICMLDALQNAVHFGISLESAVQAATQIPARVIGMEKEIGRISVGCRADLVILDPELRLETVIIGGRIWSAKS